MEFPEFLEAISTLPRKSVWRHNQAGDLPGLNNAIDGPMLKALVKANKKASLHGFTYTHKPMNRENAKLVKYANENGFTINISADTLKEADEMAKLNVAPVVVIIPPDSPETMSTPGGRKVITCPAQSRDRVNCMNCRLCADGARTTIIGFRAHGSGSGRVIRIQKALEEVEKTK